MNNFLNRFFFSNKNTKTISDKPLLVWPILELEDDYDFYLTIDGRIGKIFKSNILNNCLDCFYYITQTYKFINVQLISLYDEFYVNMNLNLDYYDFKMYKAFNLKNTDYIKQNIIIKYKFLLELENTIKNKFNIKLTKYPNEDCVRLVNSINKYNVFKLKQSINIENKDYKDKIKYLFKYKYVNITKLGFDNFLKSIYITETPLEEMIENKILVIRFV